MLKEYNENAPNSPPAPSNWGEFLDRAAQGVPLGPVLSVRYDGEKAAHVLTPTEIIRLHEVLDQRRWLPDCSPEEAQPTMHLATASMIIDQVMQALKFQQGLYTGQPEEVLAAYLQTSTNLIDFAFNRIASAPDQSKL